MLNYDLGMKIIKRINHVFNKDINIIRTDGIIIASSNESRVNTYHEGARISASSNREVIITKNNKHMYRGSREGVNMPISYNNKVIGVIGITGTESEVIPYAPLIKELVESIISEVNAKSLDRLKRKYRNNYFKEIIKGIDDDDVETYYSRAKLQEIDMSTDRYLIVININEAEDDCKNIANDFKNKILNGHSNNEIDIISLYDNELVLLIPSYLDYKKYIEEISSILNKLKLIRYKFILAEKCKDILDYQRAYTKAIRVNNLESNNKEKRIVYVGDYEIALLIKGISKNYKEQYMKYYLEKIFSNKEKLAKETIETIKMYFENNMRIDETARRMYLHRNTIMYRLNKFKNLCNIDINNTYECTKLYLAILIYEEMKREIRTVK